MKSSQNYSQDLIATLDDLAYRYSYLYPNVRHYRDSKTYGRIKSLKFDTANIFGDTPLKYAAFWGHVDLVRELLSLGANPNMQGEDMESPLHVAVGRGHAEIVKMLLASRADIQLRNLYGKRPIDLAVSLSRIGNNVEEKRSRQRIIELFENQAESE